MAIQSETDYDYVEMFWVLMTKSKTDYDYKKKTVSKKL